MIEILNVDFVVARAGLEPASKDKYQTWLHAFTGSLVPVDIQLKPLSVFLGIKEGLLGDFLRKTGNGNENGK